MNMANIFYYGMSGNLLVTSRAIGDPASRSVVLAGVVFARVVPSLVVLRRVVPTLVIFGWVVFTGVIATRCVNRWPGDSAGDVPERIEDRRGSQSGGENWCSVEEDRQRGWLPAMIFFF